MRERFFTPRVRVKSYEELNALLLDGVIAYAKAHPHPEERERTVWERFEVERAALVPYAGRFDGFHAISASVSTTCLVRFDNNRYSVMASAIGRPVEVRAYAERVEIRQDGRVVAEHERAFGRDQTARGAVVLAVIVSVPTSSANSSTCTPSETEGSDGFEIAIVRSPRTLRGSTPQKDLSTEPAEESMFNAV